MCKLTPPCIRWQKNFWRREQIQQITRLSELLYANAQIFLSLLSLCVISLLFLRYYKILNWNWTEQFIIFVLGVKERPNFLGINDVRVCVCACMAVWICHSLIVQRESWQITWVLILEGQPPPNSVHFIFHFLSFSIIFSRTHILAAEVNYFRDRFNRMSVHAWGRAVSEL